MWRLLFKLSRILRGRSSHSALSGSSRTAGPRHAGQLFCPVGPLVQTRPNASKGSLRSGVHPLGGCFHESSARRAGASQTLSGDVGVAIRAQDGKLFRAVFWCAVREDVARAVDRAVRIGGRVQRIGRTPFFPSPLPPMTFLVLLLHAELSWSLSGLDDSTSNAVRRHLTCTVSLTNGTEKGASFGVGKVDLARRGQRRGMQCHAALLEVKGYDVACAANGREALDCLQQAERPWLILLDMSMPVMDGWQFREQYRQASGLASIPVFLLSAESNFAQIAAFLGVAGYFPSPSSLTSCWMPSARSVRPRVRCAGGLIQDSQRFLLVAFSRRVCPQDVRIPRLLRFCIPCPAHAQQNALCQAVRRKARSWTA